MKTTALKRTSKRSAAWRMKYPVVMMACATLSLPIPANADGSNGGTERGEVVFTVDSAAVCGYAGCLTTEDVEPVFINGVWVWWGE